MKDADSTIKIKGFLAIDENGTIVSNKKFNSIDEANEFVKEYKSKERMIEICKSLNNKYNHNLNK